jgi:hypothetical protein
MTTRFSCVLVGAMLLCPAMAMASGADDKAAAQVLFDEGRKLMDAGKFAEACPKLESSQRLDPGAGTLLNLAACYDKNGQTASAWVTYTDAATASEERHPDWAKRASERAKALYPKLSKLTIDLANPPAGAAVKRDGKPVDTGSLGVAMPVDPGHHVIDVTAPGKLPFHSEVDVAAQNADAHVAVALEAAPVDQQHVDQQPLKPVEPLPPADTGRGNGQRIAGIVIAGVGVVGVGVGAVFGAIAIGQKNAATPNCSADLSRCNSAGKASIDSAFTSATVSTIAFIAGGVLAVTGLIVFIVAPRSKETASASLILGPGSVSFGGTF